MKSNEQELDLSADEDCVLQFLKTWPEAFVSLNEIARRAGGRARHKSESRWPDPVLSQLVALELVESDGQARYRVKGRPVRPCAGKERFISPHLRAILEQHNPPVGAAP